jgi:hypothetical protein
MAEKDVYLSKDDWNLLDTLLGKHGFGGYYDLVECLKLVLSRITKGQLDLTKIKDLPSVVAALTKYSKEG